MDMIKKQFRLKEREVKKVLGKVKPFFSSWIVLNKKINKKPFNRFAIVIWAKSVNTNVTRVFFRRKFYDIIMNSKLFNNPSPFTTFQGLPLKKEDNVGITKFYDFVFVVKKQTKLDRKKIDTIKTFENDLNFLIKKVK